MNTNGGVMPDPFTKMAGAVFLLSSFAGIAALLRSGQVITYRAFFAAFMNSGIIGLITYYFYYESFDGGELKLIGICMLSGVGGASLIDTIFQFLGGKIKLNVSIRKNK